LETSPYPKKFPADSFTTYAHALEPNALIAVSLVTCAIALYELDRPPLYVAMKDVILAPPKV
jgi:hypothetical protein